LVGSMRREWTEEEIKILRELYGKVPARVIAGKLGRSVYSIVHKANRLGLRSSVRLRVLDRTKPSNINLTREMATYLAGLIDGDGCISIRPYGKKHTFSPRIEVSSKNYDFLEKLKNIIGGGSISRQVDRRNGSITYHLYFEKLEDCKKILEAITPFLILKKRQGELLLEFCNIRLQRPIWKRLEFTEREKEIYMEIRKLNSEEKRRKMMRMIGDA